MRFGFVRTVEVFASYLIARLVENVRDVADIVKFEGHIIQLVVRSHSYKVD